MAYAISANKYYNTGTHRPPNYIENNKVTYFDSFGAKQIPEDIRFYQ